MPVSLLMHEAEVAKFEIEIVPSQKADAAASPAVWLHVNNTCFRFSFFLSYSIAQRLTKDNYCVLQEARLNSLQKGIFLDMR